MFLFLFYHHLNLLCSVINFFPKWAWGTYACTDSSQLLVYYFCGIGNIVVVVGMLLLFAWKRIGFWILLTACILASFASIAMESIPFQLIGLLICYLVLKLKRDGISCWDNLE